MFSCTSAVAGGSFEPVHVNRINIINGVEYELVVTPLNMGRRDGYADPYMGQCAIFTVYGVAYVVAPIALLIALIVLFVFLAGRKRG
jgi:hypothetical protein